MLTALLLARPVFAALLVLVVGVYVWTGYETDRRAQRRLDVPQVPGAAKGQRRQ
jgi:hypothetical protein